MKRLAIFIVLGVLCFNANAQKYLTKNGYIGFFSHTPLEDIKADNNQVASVLDASTGELVFQVLIKSFHFAKALMETHFNESFLESEKYPKATFTGKITNIPEVKLSEKGTYEATVEGDLTIHNVTRKLSAKGTVEVLEDGINANSKFTLQPEDFNITIPSVVRNNIAKTIEVTVIMKYAAVGEK
jgi:polyisoprenoid-binding protein YceI